MAHKKGHRADVAMIFGEYKPPTRKEIIAQEARHIGERLADSHPKVKKVRDAISSAVEKAVKSALKGK